jgi:glutamine cyclotransferase
MSDGTDKLTYIDPDNYAVVKSLPITEDNTAIENVNELEFIRGYIWANVWMTNDIVKIDTATGNIVGKMNLDYLFDDAKSINPDVDVMNGIAWDSVNDRIFVTGKLWPHIYQIEFPH